MRLNSRIALRVWPRASARTLPAATPSRYLTISSPGTASGLSGGDAPDVVSGVSVSTNHFDVFGVQPILGRGLLPEDGELLLSGLDQPLL